MATATQSFQFSNIAATTAGFVVKGGNYGQTVVLGGGSVQLQILGPDNTTWLNVGAAVSANGFASLTLVPGQYRFLLTGASGVFAALTSVPS